jgi:hypothetical protein
VVSLFKEEDNSNIVEESQADLESGLPKRGKTEEDNLESQYIKEPSTSFIKKSVMKKLV